MNKLLAWRSTTHKFLISIPQAERRNRMSDMILSPNDGQLVWLGGLGVHFKLDGTSTQGAFSVVEHPLEPGAFAPPHTHSREDEFSYVLEGTVGVMLGDQEFLVTSGSYIVKPRGIPHAFWNPGPEPARLLEIIAPAGFERYFMQLAALVNKNGPPDDEAIGKLASEYGLTYHMEQVLALATKYGLKVPGR
jgi:quercetin dioxygenase-like cupin family protein